MPFLVTGIAWLSDRVFALADADKNCFFLFSLLQRDHVSPANPVALEALVPTILYLPTIRPNWHISFFQLETTPLLASTPSDRPFTASPESHIIVFTLQYSTTGHRETSGRYLGFVHNRTLLAYAPGDSSSREGNEISWSEWGPMNTRIMPNRFSRTVFAR